MDKIIVSKDVLEIRKNVQEEKKRTFLGSVKKRPNMTVWEASLITGDVAPAKMQMMVGVNGKKTHEVKTRENHIYCYALNGKNAVRKLQKVINGR
jgi:hypothetical protein